MAIQAAKRNPSLEENSAERIKRVKFAYIGSVNDVQRGLDELVEKVNPEWFVWQGDQEFLPKDEVKRQIELFGKNFCRAMRDRTR